MKSLISLLLVLLLCYATEIHAQPNNPKQQKTALKFIHLFMQDKYDKCWAMFDHETNSSINQEQFIEALNQMKKGLPSTSEDIELFMSGYKMIQNNKAVFYSFKYENDISAGFLFDVLFISEDALLVAGFQPKGRVGGGEQAHTAVSSKGQETVISEKEVIEVASDKYVCRGINIIHFAKNQGMIAIQIEQALPEGLSTSEMKTWANKQAIKFAKWLYKSPYFQNAQTKASEMQRQLLDEIGVSFINPDSGAGFNTMVKKKDYE